MSNAGSGEFGCFQIPGSMDSVEQSPACKLRLLAENGCTLSQPWDACGPKVLLGNGGGLAWQAGSTWLRIDDLTSVCRRP
jgi:hypothetical protein